MRNQVEPKCQLPRKLPLRRHWPWPSSVWAGPRIATCLALGLATLTTNLNVPFAWSDTTVTRMFTRTHGTTRDGCSIVQVNFTSRIQYQSHFPLAAGNEVVIRIRFIEPDLDGVDADRPGETASIPLEISRAVDQISLAFDEAGAADLRVRFRSHVDFAVAQAKDLTSIVIAIRDGAAAADCQPQFDVAAGPPAPLPEAPPQPEAAAAPSVLDDPALTDANRTEMRQLVTDARTALTAGDNRTAISLLSRATRIPRNALSPEAQELLGVARERNQQLAHAKAEYEAYLAQFPESPNAPRVQQRLAALLTAAGKPRRAGAADLDKAPDEAPGVDITWGGSVAERYILDNTIRTVKDEFFGTDSESETNQNELQSNAELFADFAWKNYEGELRFAGAKTIDFTDQNDDETTVSELFGEIRNTDLGLGLRLGRQSRHSGGVLGRFDGALLSWEIEDKYELAVSGGFPVVHKSDTPDTETRFIGASLEVSDIVPGLDGTVYAIGQRAGSLDDRRAVGMEMRYFDSAVAAFGGVEYDLFYKGLNNFYVNGSYTFPDRSTLSASFDHRNAPVLQTINALQGQPVDTLDELRDLFTDSEIYDLARDRTARSTTGTLGYTRPLNSKFQVGLDATVSYFSGTDESGGVPATPSTGVDYFLSSRLTGTSIIKEGDIVTGILRYSDTSSSTRYRGDLRLRYPVTRKFRVSPTIGVEYRTGNSSDFTENAVNGRLGLDYALRKNVYLEAEAGGRYSWRDDAGTKSRTLDSYVFLGIRVDF